MHHIPAKSRTLPVTRMARPAAGITALGLSLALVACQNMPTTQASGHTQAPSPSTTKAAAQGKAAPATETITTATGSGAESVVTETLNCVPTKEAQALGLSRTERVVAAYHIPGEQEAGETSVRLTMGGKTYTLREAPSASGARYIVGEGLVAGHKGFSWNTKRSEAIISGLVAGGGVDSVMDGPLLYRCMSLASPDASQ
ncbi:MAG: MliC family protein [Lautropia sp.]|nr:MliC family protein [Lautropia sp.]